MGAVRANAGIVVTQLGTANADLTYVGHEGALRIVVAFYDLDTGRVSLLG